MAKRGFFFSLEGGEGVGKSTAIEQLYRHFMEKNIPCIKTKAPGGSKSGLELARLLMDPSLSLDPLAELFLFLADQAELVSKVILPALEAGKVVLCDRYRDSMVAYQGYARALGAKKVRELCELATQGCSPDRTFCLDLDPMIGLKRAQARNGSRGDDRIEQESLTFHHNVRTGFLSEAATFPERIRVIEIDGCCANHVQAIIIEEIDGFLRTNWK